jgi:hypothetical protein
MKFLTIIGALIGLVYVISGFAALVGSPFVPTIVPAFITLNTIVYLIVGLVVVILTLLAAVRPGDPVPFHWLVLFILGILLIIFGGGLIAGILVIIAALIGLIEDL